MRINTFNMICEPLTCRPCNKKLCNSLYIERESDIVKEFPDDIVGLQDYFQRAAWEDDINGYVKIYIIKHRWSRELIGYFGLKAGMVSIDSDNRNNIMESIAKENNIKLVPYTVPGIEISHFAINDNYRKKHSRDGVALKGLGKYIYPTFIYPIIKKLSELAGIKIVYLNSVDGSGLAHYYEESFGFHKVSGEENIVAIQPYYDNGCTFMYKIIS